MTGAELKQRAAAWVARELERARAAHGPAWPVHAQWVIQYVRAEAAERLARMREGARR